MRSSWGAYPRLHVNQRVVNEPGTYTPSGGSITVPVARPVVYPARVPLGPRGALLFFFFFSICVASTCLSVFFFLLWLLSVTVTYVPTLALRHMLHNER